MGTRPSALEEKEKKIEETNLNFGLVNVNEEISDFKRGKRTEIGVGILLLILVLFCIRDMINRCKQQRLTKAAASKLMGNHHHHRLSPNNLKIAMLSENLR